MTNTHPTHPALPALIASGGDSRLDLSAGRMANRYGCRYEPEPGLLAAGSCTGSTISGQAFDAVRDASATIPSDPGQLADWADRTCRSIRDRLASHFVGAATASTDVLLTPSGTDAEYVPLILAGAAPDRRIATIVVAPTEVGSGTTLAAAGEHFDGARPLTDRAAEDDPFEGLPIELRTVAIRGADGVVREPDEMDAEITDMVDDVFDTNDVVIVHVVAHSKTGVHAPSLPTVQRLQDRHGERLHVVVDAAQGRISRRGMREALARQRIIILTGSKFYGGPPFSGCVFVPRRYRGSIRRASMPARALAEYFSACEAPEALVAWRTSVNPAPNVGLILRWIAALAEIDAYYATPPLRRYLTLRSFEELAPQRLAGAPSILVEESAPLVVDDGQQRLLESKRTVFSFRLLGRDGRRLDADRLRRVQAVLRDGTAIAPNDRGIRAIETGQPVRLTATGDAVLRIALGAQLMQRWAYGADVHAAVSADLDVVVSALTRAIELTDPQAGAHAR